MARLQIIVSTVAAASALMAQPALAGAHAWKVVEAFSTSDESIQFIELWCATPNETGISGLSVTSQATGNSYTFTSGVSESANKRILLATAAFAALPGAPTPDHTIPAGFFDHDADTLRYHTYDTWVIASGAVPTDCVNSLNRNPTTGAVAPAPNSPTNFKGDDEQIHACPDPPCPSDLNDDNTTDVNDLLLLIGAWGTSGAQPADINGDLIVDVNDLLALIGNWGDC